MDTVFAKEKTRTRVQGAFQELSGAFSALSKVKLAGYEIHMGETTLREGIHPLTGLFTEVSRDSQESQTGFEAEQFSQTNVRAKADGACNKNAAGTYVHGIFEKEETVRAFLSVIGDYKGLDVTDLKGLDFQKFKETQYDLLASELRKNLDLEKVYEILEAGV